MCLLVSSNRVPARTHAGDATQYVPCRNLRREETSLHRATRTRTHARATCDPPSHPAQPVAARVWRLLRAAYLLPVSLATGPLFCTHPSRASVLVAASVPSQNRLISHGRHPAGLARITDSSLPVSPPACTGPASSASRGGKALTAPGVAVRIRHRSLRCGAQTSDGQERASMLLTAHDAVPARDTETMSVAAQVRSVPSGERAAQRVPPRNAIGIRRLCRNYDRAKGRAFAVSVSHTAGPRCVARWK